MFDHTTAKAIQEEKRRQLGRSAHLAKPDRADFQQVINVTRWALEMITAATRKLVPGLSRSPTTTPRDRTPPENSEPLPRQAETS